MIYKRVYEVCKECGYDCDYLDRTDESCYGQVEAADIIDWEDDWDHIHLCHGHVNMINKDGKYRNG